MLLSSCPFLVLVFRSIFLARVVVIRDMLPDSFSHFCLTQILKGNKAVKLTQINVISQIDILLFMKTPSVLLRYLLSRPFRCHNLFARCPSRWMDFV